MASDMFTSLQEKYTDWCHAVFISTSHLYYTYITFDAK